MSLLDLCRYQLQGEKLQVENIKLTEELESQKTSLQDINEFLTNELKAKTAVTNTLEETITGLEAKLKQQKTQYEVIKCSTALHCKPMTTPVSHSSKQLES